jgi:hypothetical protein
VRLRLFAAAACLAVGVLPTASFAAARPAAALAGCRPVWVKPAHVASDMFGNHDAQLSLVQGNLAVSRDHSTLVVRLAVSNLSLRVPAGATAMDWYATWSYNGVAYFAQAQYSALGPVFVDGTYTSVDSSNQYTARTNDTGHFVTGSHGAVIINVALAHVGKPGLGAVLRQPAGYTYTELGVPEVAGSLRPVDSAGPGRSYVVGSCTT